MDKNKELLLHIFFLQRDHNIGFSFKQLVGILYSSLCELKYQGISHEYTYNFKRGSQSPTSTEIVDILKSLVEEKHLEQFRRSHSESFFKLGIKGAMVGNKITALDPVLQNCIMGWIGYFTPMGGTQLERHLHERFRLRTLEIGDSIPLKNPFNQKHRPGDYDENWDV